MPRTPRTTDPEVAAMAAIAAALEPLDSGGRRRVTEWAYDRYVPDAVRIGADLSTRPTYAADPAGGDSQ